jgi:uncharacterized protein YdhG (YjbR/CyaY superfamily)
MKKTKGGGGTAAGKWRGGPKNVDEYLARVPETARGMLERMRAAIRSAMPAEATETISYRIPAFQMGAGGGAARGRRNKGVLVWFAAFSDHCSLFPTAAVIEAFKDELKGFSKSKGTIHFPLDKPLPTALIKQLVRARVAQYKEKKRRASG